MSLYNKIKYLLPVSFKKKLIFLYLLLIIGMILEMLGLGILIPAIGFMSDNEIGTKYPKLLSILQELGLTSKIRLVVGGMLILIFFFIFKAFFLIYLSWRQSKFSATLSAYLSEKLFLGYLQKPYTFHLQNNSSTLIRNIQSEVSFFSSITQSAIGLTTEISIIISISFVLFYVTPLGATVVTLFFAVSAYLFQLLTKKKLLFWGEQRQLHEGKINLHLLQGLGGVKDVKLFGRENYFLNKFNDSNFYKANISTKQFTLQQIPRLYLELLAVVGLLGLVIIMTLENASIQHLISTLGIFVVAAFRMIPSINRIMVSLQSIRFAEPVVDNLYIEFKKIQNDDLIKTSKSQPVKFNSEIFIENLIYEYPDSNSTVLKSISLKIKFGEAVGFVGSSGSGKSTMVDLILGLLIPKSGRILVDGINIHNNIKSWQKIIGYVPQSIYLTDDSLRRNIAFGIPDNEIDNYLISSAIKYAQIESFINNLPEGLDTVVGERGVRLSGGQRQRIGIARALYNNPEVLILDEATSSLDNETEKRIMDAVNLLKGKKTLIIVAHRLSTLSDCDTIYNFDKGKVLLSKL
jgi:ABC-type multidrug transport system fused ATPase/permease subunit